MIPNFNNNGPCFELFNAQLDMIKYWKLKGKISKEFDPHNKSNSYLLHFGGVSSLSTPIDEKRSLQINNSCLLFQFILYNIKSFSLEICVRDKSDTKRRFNITSGIKEIDSKSLYIKIPFANYPVNIWTNLLIDLSLLTQSYFKTQTFKTIESIHITGNLKIRKIFSLRTKDEPVLKSIDMGKSTPSVNLLFKENGEMVYTNIKILGVNTTHINTVNIDSKLIQNKKKGSPSPQPNNHSKYSTTSDIMLNRHKQIYQKKNKEQNGSINNINNININININNLKKEQVAIKIKDNKDFINKLPDVNNIENKFKNKKENIKLKKFINNIKSSEEGDNIANIAIHNININNINNTNINNAMKNNFVEKKKSLGNYIHNQKNKKRNKSNNPYLRPKINKKNENSILKEERSVKKFNKPSNKKLETKEKQEKINQANEINNESSTNDNYYDSKEKEISLEDYSPDTRGENKFKFNNISLGSSLVNKNQPKEEEKESKTEIINNNPNIASIQKPNKFSNYNMLLESGIDIKNIPIYDSIEEVAEWPGGDWNAVQGEGVGDKLIKLDYTKKAEKKNDNINIDDEDLLEFNSLEKKGTYRPYTPPIEELVQVNPNKMKGDSNTKVSLDKNSSLNRKGTFKNYENLIYNEEKGLLFDPITNKYYDIKAK